VNNTAIPLPRWLQRGLPWAAAALLFLLMLLGGAPPRIIRLGLESLALLALAALFWLQVFHRPAGREALAPAVFLLAILLVPAIQLVPLPPSIWSGLPGREFAAEAFRVAGIGEPWRPISLDPEATRDTALTLVAPLAILFATYAIPPRRRYLLAYAAVVVGLLSASLAFLQFASPGNPSLYISVGAITTSPSGIIANRNMQCDILLIAMLLGAWWIRRLRRTDAERERESGLRPWHFALPLIAFMGLMVVLTQSRAGLLLLAPVGLACLAIIFPGGLRREIPIGVGIALAIGAALFLLAPGFSGEFLSRFGGGPESRIDALEDLLYAADLYLPVGSGVGTFVPVYTAAESLSLLEPTYLNHAHNDYLEIYIETGIVGILLVILFLIAFGIRAWRVARAGGDGSYLWLQRVSAMAIALLLVHSITDYPLRSITLVSLFAFLCAILFSRAPPALPRRRRRPE
jgi:hypothetical protein